MLSHGTPFSSQVKRGVRPPVELRQEHVLFLEVQEGSQTSFHVVTGYSGFHSSLCRGIRPSLELKGNLMSFCLAAGSVVFLLSFNR